jgi:hypothetical protein
MQCDNRSSTGDLVAAAKPKDAAVSTGIAGISTISAAGNIVFKSLRVARCRSRNWNRYWGWDWRRDWRSGCSGRIRRVVLIQYCLKRCLSQIAYRSGPLRSPLPIPSTSIKFTITVKPHVLIESRVGSLKLCNKVILRQGHKSLVACKQVPDRRRGGQSKVSYFLLEGSLVHRMYAIKI